MAVSHNDRFQLSQDVAFQNRVQSSLIAACIAIANEGWAIAFHRERSQRCSEILSAPTSPTNWVSLFAMSVATDTAVINAATQSGTVALTSGNRAAQAALVTDAQIDSAISAQFNAFIREPGN